VKVLSHRNPRNTGGPPANISERNVLFFRQWYGIAELSIVILGSNPGSVLKSSLYNGKELIPS
jgi:hypothetical protein